MMQQVWNQIVPIGLSLVYGILQGCFLYWFFRHMPIGWLLDYGETQPSEACRRSQDMAFWPRGLFILLASMVSVVLIWQAIGPSLQLPLYIVIAAILLLIMVADLTTHIIPDQFVLSMALSGVLIWLLDSLTGQAAWSSILLRLLAAGAGGGFLWLAGWLGALIMQREAMGMGDVKLLAACGFLIGWPNLLFVIFLAFILAAVPAVIILVRRQPAQTDNDQQPSEQADELAFGPYLALATFLTLLYSEQLKFLWEAWLNQSW